MIYITDEFLPANLLNAVRDDKNSFEKVDTPGKSFWVKYPSEEFINYVEDKISAIEGQDIENVLCFFREAKGSQDNDWRIHNDAMIKDQLPDRAAVLYISDEDREAGLNGTAFWSHKIHGDTYKGSSADDFNELLINDSNDVSKWDLKTIVGHKKNRLISYPCEYFHSKYPNEFKNSRQILVMFYKTNKDDKTKTE